MLLPHISSSTTKSCEMSWVERKGLAPKSPSLLLCLRDAQSPAFKSSIVGHPKDSPAFS